MGDQQQEYLAFLADEVLAYVLKPEILKERQWKL